MAKITHEREKCIGCGSCVAVCPACWEMTEDGKSKLIGSQSNVETGEDELETQDIDCNQNAADACPVKIIHIQ